MPDTANCKFVGQHLAGNCKIRAREILFYILIFSLLFMIFLHFFYMCTVGSTYKINSVHLFIFPYFQCTTSFSVQPSVGLQVKDTQSGHSSSNLSSYETCRTCHFVLQLKGVGYKGSFHWLAKQMPCLQVNVILFIRSYIVCIHSHLHKKNSCNDIFISQVKTYRREI